MVRAWLLTGALAACALLAAPGPAAARAAGPAPGRVLRVEVTLNPRDPAALAAYARAVSTPGTPYYRRYLTPGQFARRFGPTAAQVAGVRRALERRGLHPGAAAAGALSIPVVATARQLERAFSVPAGRLAQPGRQGAIVDSVRAAARGGAAASAVQAVVGLDARSGPRPLLVRPAARAQAAASGPVACPAAQAGMAGPAGEGAHTTDQIAAAYGFSALYGAGDLGQGVTVAVYELESDDPGDVAAYQSCYGTHASVTYIPVDGGAGAGPGSGEAALDIENLIGFAPDARVLVYQGPNSQSGAPGSGPYDTFKAIIDDDRARVVTVSWGQCEPTIGQATAVAENTLFQKAAVQGQTIVAADGDSGAQDCNIPGGIPATQTAVDDPSSQPYVTGVGGTSLNALGPRPSETVWNSGNGPQPGDQQPGASGGGVSRFWTMPAAQLSAAPALGVRSALAAGGACGMSSGWCREVPDVAADADPATGYLFYWNGNGSVPGQPQGWQGIGGTSAAAPLWAALLTLADGYPACAGRPVGFANPALYRAAGGDYAGTFNDVTAGNNDFTATNGGRFAAAPGYDPVTGLGSPNAATLVPALCQDSLALAAPATQRTTVHTRASLRLQASDVTGAGLRFDASGLPPGLRLNGSTGAIAGRPFRTGRYRVRVVAVDGAGATTSAAFAWMVGGPPRLSRVRLATAGRGAPQLSLTVRAAAQAPALRSFALRAPRGLRLATARHGIGVRGTGRHAGRLRFTARLTHGVLSISLRAPAAAARITLGAPALRVAGGRTPKSSLAGGRLSVSVTDAGGGTVPVGARLP